MIKEYFAALTRPAKTVFLMSALGVSLAAGLTLTARYYMHEATKKEQLANQLRDQAAAAKQDALAKAALAADLQTKLDKANGKVSKLQAELDKIKVPPKPGPAPEDKKQLIADLQGLGLELVVKPSTMIAPALVGITERDGKTVWTWGKESLRVPFLEQKIDAQQNLVTGLTKAKDIAEKLADSRSKQADASDKAATAYQKEADNIRIALDDTKKAMKAERKKKLLYLAGGALAGYATSRAIHR